MAIEVYEGTIGSGKSYHALERIVQHLGKKKPVIANFPLRFTESQLKAGWGERFMYMPDDLIFKPWAPAVFVHISKQHNWFEDDSVPEGHCLVVIDEAGSHFSPDQAKGRKEVMDDWKTMFTQSRKLKYDFVLVCQDQVSQINRTIRKCAEYVVKHRKANNIFPFSLLPFTIFMYNTYWAQQNIKLKSESSIYMKKFASLYNSYKLFGNMDKLMFEFKGELPTFGNCTT